MTMVQWSNEYSVEIQEIDDQHQRLVSMINELYEAMAQKHGEDKIGAILKVSGTLHGSGNAKRQRRASGV